MKENLIECKDCGRAISRRAEKCPRCGAPLHRMGFAAGLAATLFLALVAAVTISLFLRARSEVVLRQATTAAAQPLRPSMEALEMAAEKERLKPDFIGKQRRGELVQDLTLLGVPLPKGSVVRVVRLEGGRWIVRLRGQEIAVNAEFLTGTFKEVDIPADLFAKDRDPSGKWDGVTRLIMLDDVTTLDDFGAIPKGSIVEVVELKFDRWLIKYAGKIRQILKAPEIAAAP